MTSTIRSNPVPYVNLDYDTDADADPWNRTPNRAKLLDLGRWLTEQERKRRLGLDSEWDQGVWIRATSGLMIQGEFAAWSCGTSCCAAGHVALLEGGRPSFFYDGAHHAEPRRDEAGKPYVFDVSDSAMIFGNQAAGIDSFAAMTLGLTPEQRDALFDGDNDWDAMMSHLADILGEPEAYVITLVGGDELPEDPDEGDEGW